MPKGLDTPDQTRSTPPTPENQNSTELNGSTSSTHSQRQAIALAYEPSVVDAPRVVASGKGAVADRILEVARANNVTVREDPALASMLSAVDVNSVIPTEAFSAVAEILAFVYRSTGYSPLTDPKKPAPSVSHSLNPSSPTREP